MKPDSTLTDPSAREAAATERPIESHGRALGADLRHAAWLIGQYVKHDPVAAIGLMTLVLGTTFVSTYLALRGQIYLADLVNALVARNAAVVPGLVGLLLALTAATLAVSLGGLWAGLAVRMRFRSYLSPTLINRWMADNRFFHLERQAPLDYPEQRIQEDVFLFAERFITLGPGVLGALYSMGLYTSQLWRMSPAISIPALGADVSIPGFLVYFAVAFGLISTLMVHFAGRSLTRVEVVRQHLEAQFRAEMAAVRSNAEAVAFIRAGDIEHERISGTFDLIRQNWRAYTWSHMKIDVLQTLPTSLLMVAPTLLLAPFVIRRELQVGDIALAAAALGQVYFGVGVITTYYAELAIFRSSVARLRLLHERLGETIHSDVDVIEEARADIATSGLRIAFPNGQLMNDIGDLTIRKGDRILIQGRSGVGKSTLLRAVAGLWPFGAGAVRLPADARIAFLPQRPYMPDGTLAELLAYPAGPEAHSDERYAELLRALDLNRLVGCLHQPGAWSRILSPGEQQRLAGGRAILAEPDYLFVDEATSALDPQLETGLYALISQQLPRVALISVAHRPEVAQHHDRILALGQGPVLLRDIDRRPAGGKA
ncbi:MAG: ABC transporter ATP-binding protein/permease [Brevundimonas sp.]